MTSIIVQSNSDRAAPARLRLVQRLLTTLVVAACVYRVWLVVRYNPIDNVWSDMSRHWAEGTHPRDATPIAAMDPVLFQMYLGALAKLTAGSSTLIAWWTALLSLSAPWLWYRFLRELLPTRPYALAGWAILASLPSWTAIYSYFMQETLMLPLLGAALWATWRARRKGDVAGFVVAVGLWLAAGLTRGICLPLGAVAMTWLWLEQGEKLRRASISLCLVAAIFVPLAGRSWSTVRLIAPYGIAGVVNLNFLAGTRSVMFDFTRSNGREHWTYGFISPSMNHPPLAPLSEWTTWREGEARFQIDLDAGTRDWDAAKAMLPPWSGTRALKLTGESLVHLFFGPSWPDSDIEGRLRRDVGRANYWMRWLWAPLALACAVIVVLRWRQQRERILPALLLTWFLVQGVAPIALNEGRYRKPFEGLLVAQALILASGWSSRRVSPPR